VEKKLHDGFLMKPIQSKMLHRTLVRLLGIRQGDRQGVVTPQSVANETMAAMKILLAEDNPINQKLAFRMLTKMGHTVDIVQNGYEAVQAYSQASYDMILMDVQMPEMDGMEATGRIRSKEAGTGRHIPIIAMTAHAMKGDREKCIDAGMDGYVSKPVRSAELVRELNRVADVFSARVITTQTAACSRKQEAIAVDSDIIDECDAMDRLEGDREMYDELLDLFLEHCDNMVQCIRDAMGLRDCEMITKSCHAIKGALANISAKPAQAAAAEAEQLAKQGDILGAGKTIDVLFREVERLRVYLASIRKETPA
jgi:CheY-like chemotaxis protein